MPAIITQASCDITGGSGKPKQPKKEYNTTQNYRCQLTWCVRNRKDYNPPTLRQPYGIHISEKYVLTTEGLWPHSRVQIFNHAGKSQKIIGQGQILPFGVLTNVDDQIVMTDHCAKTVKAFSVDGKLAWSWESKKFVWPNGIAVNAAGQYVVTDWSTGCVCICDPSGDIVGQFPTTDLHSENISCPDYVCVDQYNRIILSDTYDQSIKIFDNEGRFLFKTGHQPGPGFLKQPKGVTTDEKNNMIVADWGTSCIKMFTSNGNWVEDLTDPDCLKYPLAVGVYDNKLVVTEHKLNSSPSMKMFTIT